MSESNRCSLLRYALSVTGVQAALTKYGDCLSVPLPTIIRDTAWTIDLPIACGSVRTANTRIASFRQDFEFMFATRAALQLEFADLVAICPNRRSSDESAR
jgi:hypothetical protein